MHDTLTHVRKQLAKPRTVRRASPVEYGLLVALIAVLIVGGVSLLGPEVEALLAHSASGGR